jgi:hypothetical protein
LFNTPAPLSGSSCCHLSPFISRQSFTWLRTEVPASRYPAG